MKQNITLLDGAVGTNLWKLAEENGAEKVPVWQYNVTHPEFIRELCRRFIDAGSRQILANTFSANRQTVARYKGFDVSDVIMRGVRIAKEETAGKDVTVSLSVGPLMQMLEPWGDMTADEARGMFAEMIAAGTAAGADSITLQTFIDLDMIRIAAEEAVKSGLPVYAMMSFEKVGRTIMGNSVEDFIAAMEEIGVSAVGMNCTLGPDLAEPVMRQFCGKTKLPLVFKPNAGKPITAPDGTTAAAYSAEDFVRDVLPALDYVDYVGGCCGAEPSYVKLLGEKIKQNA